MDKNSFSEVIDTLPKIHITSEAFIVDAPKSKIQDISPLLGVTKFITDKTSGAVKTAVSSPTCVPILKISSSKDFYTPAGIIQDIHESVSLIYKTLKDQGYKISFDDGRTASGALAEKIRKGITTLGPRYSRSPRLCYDRLINEATNETPEKESLFIPLDCALGIYGKPVDPIKLTRLLDVLVSVPLSYLGPKKIYKKRRASDRVAGLYEEVPAGLTYHSLQPYWLRASWLIGMVVSQAQLAYYVASSEKAYENVMGVFNTDIVQRALNVGEEALLKQCWDSVKTVMKSVPTSLGGRYGLCDTTMLCSIEYLAEDRDTFSKVLRPYENRAPDRSIHGVLSNNSTYNHFYKKWKEDNRWETT